MHTEVTALIRTLVTGCQKVRRLDIKKAPQHSLSQCDQVVVER